MKKIFIVLLAAAMLFGAVACKPEAEIPSLTEEDIKAFQSYTGAFGHVRVFGDIDHVLKGEKVDDEPGVTVQSMVAGTVTVGKDSIVIPLTLTKYDYDGHRNPEDPNPELYTRTATGTLTLTVTGAMNAEGTGFVANAYTITDMALTLSTANDNGYIALELPDMTVAAAELSGRFVSKDGSRISPVTITITNGKAAGIADVNISSFEMPKAGAITINGIETDIAEL